MLAKVSGQKRRVQVLYIYLPWCPTWANVLNELTLWRILQNMWPEWPSSPSLWCFLLSLCHSPHYCHKGGYRLLRKAAQPWRQRHEMKGKNSKVIIETCIKVFQIIFFLSVGCYKASNVANICQNKTKLARSDCPGITHDDDVITCKLTSQRAIPSGQKEQKKKQKNNSGTKNSDYAFFRQGKHAST